MGDVNLWQRLFCHRLTPKLSTTGLIVRSLEHVVIQEESHNEKTHLVSSDAGDGTSH